MASDRKGRLLRFPPTLDAVLVSYALEHDLTINEAACEAVGRLRKRPKGEPVTPIEKDTTKDGELVDKAIPKRASVDTCSHPKPMRSKLKYGSVCDKEKGGCGRFIGMLPR